MAERKRRSSGEITGDLLVKRLNINQLLQLVGNKEFISFQTQILDRLQVENGIRLVNFSKVHSSQDCKIEEIDTGETIRLHGVDIDIGSWNHIAELKKMICTKHNVTSNEFFRYYGEVREGPF